MTALDEWHREQLSPSAREKLRALQAIRTTHPGNEALFEYAFRELVAELTERQVRVLARVLDELDLTRALH